MKYLNYFIQFILTILCFILFKILGPSLSSRLSGKIFEKIGPFFRSKKTIYSNIKRVYPNIDIKEIINISNLMWNNYGKVFAEFMFMHEFRSGKLSQNIEFPDHYNYKSDDIEKIISRAKKLNAKILTTEKDYLRLNKKYLEEIKFIEVELKIIDENKIIESIL